MVTDDKPKTFAEKMAHVARTAGYVQKDARNDFHKYLSLIHI